MFLTPTPLIQRVKCHWGGAGYQGVGIDLWQHQRGVENSGEGRTYNKTPPQKRFWNPPPPPMIRFPPPVCSRAVIFLRGNGHKPDQSHFLSPPRLVLEGALYGTFPPPPPNRTIRFAPPLAISQSMVAVDTWTSVRRVPKQLVLSFGEGSGFQSDMTRVRAADRACLLSTHLLA